MISFKYPDKFQRHSWSNPYYFIFLYLETLGFIAILYDYNTYMYGMMTPSALDISQETYRLSFSI